jgi:hypothetical protein
VDLAEKHYAFGFTYAFQHRLADSFLVELTVDDCEVFASVFKPFGFIVIELMVVALKVKGYWSPPVFGHYEVDDLMSVVVLRYLQTFRVSDGWCTNYVINTSEGRASPFAAALANVLASSFLFLSMCCRVKPLNCFSRLRMAARYCISMDSLSE